MTTTTRPDNIIPAPLTLPGDVKTEVMGFIILRNGWEVFITELPDDDGIGFAYVCGFEDEFGSFSMAEYEEHIMHQVIGIDTDPDSPHYVAPPPGGTWATVMRQPRPAS